MKQLVLWTTGVIAVGMGVDLAWLSPFWLVFLASGVVMMAGAPGVEARRVVAGRQFDQGGKAQHYILSYGQETVILEEGKPWTKIDTFKWVTRGLIEEPQSFQILAGGAVEINAERILLDDSEGESKLELQINKHHPPSIAHKPPVIPFNVAGLDETEASKVRFRVKIDHLGHLMIGCSRGNEHVETGLRGLATLAHSGFMLKPRSVHVDPLQRSIELDGVRFECDAAGARQLEEFLNERYAPTPMSGDTGQIGVRENAASATGFDIDFLTIQGGARLQVKGHLTQDRLNILQDHQRCDLLHPGIILRLSPPHLLIRRRVPDGGEEPLPEVPDVHYLRVEAAQLQQILNHPLVRRRTDHEAQSPMPVVSARPLVGLERIRIVHNPQNRLFLWLECHHAGGKNEGKAFTHHNVAELQHRGVFRDHLDVSLSIDNHRLSVLDLLTREERAVSLTSESDEAELAHAAELLTGALKPPASVAV